MVRVRVAAAGLLAAGLLAASPPQPIGMGDLASPAGERRDTLPGEAYLDPQAARLISRARTARADYAADLRSFDVTFRERLYAGLTGSLLRRERALFHQERAARIHWRAGGDRTIRWLGFRRGVPVAGQELEPEDDDLYGTHFSFLDPSSDQIFIGSTWALHPLADTASLHYRYRSGDTLRLRFSGFERTVTLVEVLVEPRESRFDRIAASLWFDDRTAILVRATYRPARDFDLELDEPEDAKDVPGFARPIRFATRYITVDYGLQELKFWLPNRMAFDGEATMGVLAKLPVRLEWSFEDYTIDGPDRLDPGDSLPAGWERVVRKARREGEDSNRDSTALARGVRLDSAVARAESDSSTVAPGAEAGPEEGSATERERPDVVIIVPPRDSLVRSPELPEPFGGRTLAFTAREIAEFRGRLDQIRVPRARAGRPRLIWGLGPGLARYNRVEALSSGVRFTLPSGPTARLEATARIGLADQEPNAEVHFVRATVGGGVRIGAFRRLQDTGDWGAPLGFVNSLNTLLMGYDDGLYYRATGAEVEASRLWRRLRLQARLFAERHRTAAKNTDVSLPSALGDDRLGANIRADRADVVGLAGRLRWQSGVNPSVVAWSGSVWGEAVGGDFEFGRLAGSTAVTLPLAGPYAAALQGAGGTTWGTVPRQRLYYVGGSYSLRGFDPAALAGEAFWLARGEISRAFVSSPLARASGNGAVRLLLLADAAWAGPRAQFGADGYKLGVGGGVSFLDGLLRIDIGRGVRGGDDWRVHLYVDGLL